MLRSLFCGAVALLLCAGVALADDKADKGKKNATVNGKVKKIDAATQTLTVSVRKKGEEPKDMEFKIAEDTKVTVWAGEDKKQMSAKDGFKSDQLKEGANVGVTTDPNGKVVALRIGNAPKKPKK